MKILEISRKLAELLYKDLDVYNGCVSFDFSSYEYEIDIPYIIFNGMTLKIANVIISKDGNTIEVTDDKENTYLINLLDYDDMQLNYMCIDNLLYDVYYETSYSYEIGDFENDFLK